MYRVFSAMVFFQEWKKDELIFMNSITTPVALHSAK